MHFQIYIPGASNVGSSLATVGLPEFVGNAESVREPVGPDGKGGAVFAWWNRACRQIGFRPDEQTWIKSECGKYWSGLWNAEPPSPVELVIAHEAGKRVRLGDGNEWLIPSINSAERELTLGPDGTPTFRFTKRLDSLANFKLQWIERLVNQPTFKVDNALYLELFDVALTAVKLNYRMTREVALSLSLFSTRSLIESFNVALGDLIESGVKDGE